MSAQHKKSYDAKAAHGTSTQHLLEDGGQIIKPSVRSCRESCHDLAAKATTEHIASATKAPLTSLSVSTASLRRCPRVLNQQIKLRGPKLNEHCCQQGLRRSLLRQTDDVCEAGRSRLKISRNWVDAHNFVAQLVHSDLGTQCSKSDGHQRRSANNKSCSGACAAISS